MGVSGVVSSLLCTNGQYKTALNVISTVLMPGGALLGTILMIFIV